LHLQLERENCADDVISHHEMSINILMILKFMNRLLLVTRVPGHDHGFGITTPIHASARSEQEMEEEEATRC
jgi:hypothetical protein